MTGPVKAGFTSGREKQRQYPEPANPTGDAKNHGVIQLEQSQSLPAVHPDALCPLPEG